MISFRDPAGRLYRKDGRIFREVRPEGVANLDAFLECPAAGTLIDSRRVIGTSVLSRGDGVLLEHEPVWFPSFPYEWPPEMLHAAARLTLDLAFDLLPHGVGLKDATPYNVLFRGPKPVFIDVLSFERRRPGDPIWLPYGQFLRTFLLPLLAHRSFGLTLNRIFLARRDGLEPDDLYRYAGPLRRISPLYLTGVSLPVWLAGRAADDSVYRPKSTGEEKARFILERTLGALRRKLRRLEPRPRKSAWSEYADSNSYSPAAAAEKETFVRQFLAEQRPAAVLDVGANTGRYSALAAREGARVVAIDADPAVTGDVWRMAAAQELDILPLVTDLSRPAPALGWRNGECAAFLERAAGNFDAVLMLAVIHHMLVTERVPLPEILDLAADLAKTWAVVEFVAPADPMFHRIARGRDALHAGLTAAVFEAACLPRFEIARSRELGATRSLYLLRKR